MSVAIPSQAAIVVDRTLGSSRRSSVESITTTLTDQQPLQQGWFEGTSGRKPLIFLELLLRQSEDRFADQSGYRDFDPLLTGPFPKRTVTAAQATLAQAACDSPTRTKLGFAIEGTPCVSRVVQHPPEGGAFPSALSRSRWHLALVENACDGTKAEALPRIGIEDETDHLGLGLHYFVVGRRSIGLLHVPIAVGGARKHIDRALLSAVPLATARTLGNLGPFVFRNHPLKLDQQLIFGGCAGGRSQKDQLHSTAGQLFDQQHLIGIFPTQTVGRVDQNGFDLSPRREVPQCLQTRTDQGGATIAIILELPLGRDHVSVHLGILSQRRYLAGNGVVLLLPIGGHPGVEGGRFDHSQPPGSSRAAGLEQSTSTGPTRVVRRPGPTCPAIIGRSGIPDAQFVTDWASAQPRPPPRCRTARKARLAISLKVNPVEAA